MNITILPTDRQFEDSPDAGPDCLCSRCGKPILEEEGPPIRAWPAGTIFEYRYHAACLGLVSA